MVTDSVTQCLALLTARPMTVASIPTFNKHSCDKKIGLTSIGTYIHVQKCVYQSLVFIVQRILVWSQMPVICLQLFHYLLVYFSLKNFGQGSSTVTFFLKIFLPHTTTYVNTIPN